MESKCIATLLAAVLTATPGCGADDSDTPLGMQQQSIYRGQSDTSHSAVGQIIKQGKLWCTATRVGKLNVLTAGHCFQDNLKPIDYSVRFATEDIPVVRIQTHPKYRENFRGRVYQDATLLTLAHEPSVPISPIASTLPAVGTAVTLVGYGYTDMTDRTTIGTRRFAMTEIGRVEDSCMFFPKPTNPAYGQTCGGDSGGPAFVDIQGTEVQIGVTSGSLDGAARRSCNIESYSARLDQFLPWLLEASAGDLQVYPPTLSPTSK